MPSFTEPTPTGMSPNSQLRVRFERWNRKLHFYSGLFLLFFIWLFALSGLLLNHPTWTFAEFWRNRKQASYERQIMPLASEAKGDLGQAREIMRQLALRGEILWTVTRTDPNQFEFQVRRPGHFFFIKVDFARMRVNVQQSDVNVWGIVKALHAFTGASIDDPRNTRDWALTSMWAYSMDVVAAGLIFMVLSSVYMWLKLPHRRVPGAIALGLGSITCALFCVGLRWMF